MKLKIDLSQPSTWRGLVYVITGLASMLGLTISSEASMAIMSIGLSIAGGIGFTVPDEVTLLERDDELRK